MKLKELAKKLKITSEDLNEFLLENLDFEDALSQSHEFNERDSAFIQSLWFKSKPVISVKFKFSVCLHYKMIS